MGGKMKSRLAIIGAATWEPFLPLLSAALTAYGIADEPTAFGYGRDVQVLAGNEADFEAAPPRGAVLFADPRSLFQEYLANPRSSLAPEKAAGQACCFVESAIERLSTKHRETSWILATLEPPLPNSGDGFADDAGDPFTRAVRLFDDAIRAVCQRHDGWSYFDFGRLVRLYGQQQMYDSRLDLLARIPVSANGMRWLAARLAAHWAAVVGKTKKVLALDCDNTLWGGIVGEDGLDGIQIGDDGAGRAYVAFQRAILQLESRGVLLVLCSRNNPEQVEEVFAKRPEMALARDRIAAVHIGWGRKSDGLQALAMRLGLGLDSFVFVDDNPVEREEVRQAIPEVTVPEFPAEPADLAAFGYALGWQYFYRISLGKEDRSKTDQYRLKASVEGDAEKFADHNAFLKSLGMRLTIAVNDPQLQPRAAQLCQKTNQFNLTLNRYTASELGALVEAENTFLFMGSLADRFGDHGWTTLAIVRRNSEPDAWVVDNLLMSCRVIGRGVEQAFLMACLDYVHRIARLPVRASFVLGPRNSLVSEFLTETGFTETARTPDGRREFEKSRGEVRAPGERPVEVLWNEER
jgi:FkbH-like protein